LTRSQLEAKLQEIFDSHDHDGNGKLSKDELRHCLDDLHIGLSIEYQNDICDELKVDEHGMLSFEELLPTLFDLCVELEAKEVVHGLDKDHFERLMLESFNAADKDGSGQLDPHEFRHAIKKTGLELTKEEVHELRMRTDANGDGEITIQEFIPTAFALLVDIQTEAIHDALREGSYSEYSDSYSDASEEWYEAESGKDGKATKLDQKKNEKVKENTTKRSKAKKLGCAPLTDEECAPAGAKTLKGLCRNEVEETLRTRMEEADVEKNGLISCDAFVDAVAISGVGFQHRDLEVLAELLRSSVSDPGEKKIKYNELISTMFDRLIRIEGESEIQDAVSIELVPFKGRLGVELSAADKEYFTGLIVTSLDVEDSTVQITREKGVEIGSMLLSVGGENISRSSVETCRAILKKALTGQIPVTVTFSVKAGQPHLQMHNKLGINHNATTIYIMRESAHAHAEAVAARCMESGNVSDAAKSFDEAARISAYLEDFAHTAQYAASAYEAWRIIGKEMQGFSSLSCAAHANLCARNYEVAADQLGTASRWYSKAGMDEEAAVLASHAAHTHAHIGNATKSREQHIICEGIFSDQGDDVQAARHRSMSRKPIARKRDTADLSRESVTILFRKYQLNESTLTHSINEEVKDEDTLQKDDKKSASDLRRYGGLELRKVTFDTRFVRSKSVGYDNLPGWPSGAKVKLCEELGEDGKFYWVDKTFCTVFLHATSGAHGRQIFMLEKSANWNHRLNRVEISLKKGTKFSTTRLYEGDMNIPYNDKLRPQRKFILHIPSSTTFEIDESQRNSVQNFFSESGRVFGGNHFLHEQSSLSELPNNLFFDGMVDTLFLQFGQLVATSDVLKRVLRQKVIERVLAETWNSEITSEEVEAFRNARQDAVPLSATDKELIPIMEAQRTAVVERIGEMQVALGGDNGKPMGATKDLCGVRPKLEEARELLSEGFITQANFDMMKAAWLGIPEQSVSACESKDNVEDGGNHNQSRRALESEDSTAQIKHVPDGVPLKLAEAMHAQVEKLQRNEAAAKLQASFRGGKDRVLVEAKRKENEDAKAAAAEKASEALAAARAIALGASPPGGPAFAPERVKSSDTATPNANMEAVQAASSDESHGASDLLHVAAERRNQENGSIHQNLAKFLENREEHSGASMSERRRPPLQHGEGGQEMSDNSNDAPIDADGDGKISKEELAFAAKRAMVDIECFCDGCEKVCVVGKWYHKRFSDNDLCEACFMKRSIKVRRDYVPVTCKADLTGPEDKKAGGLEPEEVESIAGSLIDQGGIRGAGLRKNRGRKRSGDKADNAKKGKRRAEQKDEPSPLAPENPSPVTATGMVARGTETSGAETRASGAKSPETTVNIESKRDFRPVSRMSQRSRPLSGLKGTEANEIFELAAGPASKSRPHSRPSRPATGRTGSSLSRPASRRSLISRGSLRPHSERLRPMSKRSPLKNVQEESPTRLSPPPVQRSSSPSLPSTEG
jgi:Ca2+-binding EF-hand superfamily protein